MSTFCSILSLDRVTFFDTLTGPVANKKYHKQWSNYRKNHKLHLLCCVFIGL